MARAQASNGSTQPLRAGLRIGPGLALAALALCLLTPTTALAFRTAADLPEFPDDAVVRWETSSPIVHLHGAVPAGMSIVEVETVLDRALTRWAEPPCSGVRPMLAGIASDPPTPGDGRNTIGWVTTRWTERGFAADAAASTDVQWAGRAIVEADIYLNADGHTWILGGDGAGAVRDLDSVLTHEIGHLLGLVHVCEELGAEGAPDCASDPAFESSTMYPFYRGSSQASLDDDTIAGICSLYPDSRCGERFCPRTHACVEATCVQACGADTCNADQRCDRGGCVDATCAGPDCVPPRCTTADDCAVGLVCHPTGDCMPARLPSGDRCAADEECTSGRCSPEGFCSRPCTEDRDCPLGATCADAGEWLVCDGAGGFGDECTAANGCLSDLCIDESDRAPYCTRGCTDRNACAPGFMCRPVDGEDVCAVARDPGCSAAGSAASALLSAILLLLTVSLRRRRS
jgi:uncharacterized protein (TIGR03382 family)